MFKFKRFTIITLIVCLMFSLTSIFALAANGDGTGGGEGDGDGDNKDIALTLVSSSVADGATDVALNETIQLNFNKNICNITVLADNKQCFHLTDPDGNAITIKLIFPDNQVQTDYRREVFIQPLVNLEPNTEYRIAVDSTLSAKNGTLIDNAHTITFTTGTSVTSEENEILSILGDYVITYESSAGENENSVPINKEGLDDLDSDNGISAMSAAKIAAIAFIFVLIAVTAVIVIVKRKK